MSSNKWAKNVILVDAVFLDKMGYIFRSNYERLLKRDINKADLAIWLESAMLDGGLRVGDNTVQVVVLFDENAEGFDNFLPSDFSKELNGKGFKGPLGEFRLAAFPAFSKVVSLKSFFLQTLENILQAEEVERLVVVGDNEECGEEIADRLTKNPDKEVTILTTAPIKGEGFKQDLLGYSLTRALGISPDEMQ